MSGLACAQGQGTGLILPSAEELRSVPLAATPFSGTELATTADLCRDLPPPGHQGQQNSCVGWTLAYAMKSYQERLEEGNPLVRSDGSPDPAGVFSPAFIYNQLNQGRDGGCHIHEALRLLEEQGVCKWNDMPYVTGDHRRQPSQQARASATRYRIHTWRQINVQSLRELKTHIQAGFPVIIGAMIDEGFERYGRPANWIWRQDEGAPKGAHAMLVVGYDDSRQAFKIINSWGRDWGNGGYCWVDYNHFGRVVRFAYVAKDARNGPGQVVHTEPRTQTDPTITTPTAIDPEPYASGIQFWVANIFHNASYPDRPDLGYFMRIDGGLRIPGTAGRMNQVVIHFFCTQQDGSVGQPVPGDLIEYRDVYGNAACGTAVYPIPLSGVDTGFTAWISYGAFRVAAGQWQQTAAGPQYQPARTYLNAVPTLFVDNFGVCTGDPISFYLDR